MKLCCFFNYPPLYRKSIFLGIDKNFDTQFYFGEEVESGLESGISKIDFSLFKRVPVLFKNKRLFGKFLWRTKAALLPLKKYDTFLVSGDLSYSYIPMILLCKILRKRIYGWGHGEKQIPGKFRFLYDFFYKNLTGYFTYGEGGKKRLVELGYDASKINVIYNSLDETFAGNETLKTDIYKKKFNNDDPVIIFIGRTTRVKKLDWIIDGVSTLNKDGFGCNLIIVGDGICLPELKQQAESAGISSRVWFYGECYDEDVNKELLYNADLCVSPGNVGLTALHSISYGVPVLSHNDFETQMPEYETIVEGKTGALYEKGNKKDFINKIVKMITLSENDRGNIRKNCYEMISEKWNSQNQLRIFGRVFKSDSN